MSTIKTFFDANKNKQLTRDALWPVLPDTIESETSLSIDLAIESETCHQ